MTRQEVYKDIEQTMGIVPTFFKQLPDTVLESEWTSFKSFEMGETAIPSKYKELIGLGVAATIHCRYCTYFHTEAARMFGATDQEITEACLMAKDTAGWSTYLNGLQLDYDQFKREFEQAREYMGRQMRTKR